jgi:hypothetical protein
VREANRILLMSDRVFRRGRYLVLEARVRKSTGRPVTRAARSAARACYGDTPSIAKDLNFAYLSPTVFRSSMNSGLARQAFIFSMLSQT